jgi:O-antigen/teichoic acid export membrane protein
LNKIKRLSAGLLLTLFIALISFYVMPHDIHENIVSFLKEIEFSKYHSLGPQISWVMVYRACMQAFFTDTQIYEHVHLFLGGYSLCLIAVGLLISFLFIFYSNIIRSWEAVCLVSLFAILGPHMSSGYKLIFGFIPIYFMLYYAQYHAEKDRHMIWFSVCFSLLVIAISLFPALFQFFFSAHSLKIMVPAILYMIVFTSIFLMIASRFTRSTQRNLTASPRM